MASRTSSAPKLRTLKIPHGFWTAPMASFHSPRQLARAQAGNTNQPHRPAVRHLGKDDQEITAGRKINAGTMASGAPIRNARSRSRHRMNASWGDGGDGVISRPYFASYTVLPPTTVRRTFVSRIFGGGAAVMS